jgi:AcrR family transcriptional regulator
MAEDKNQKETYQTIVATAQRLFMELGYRAVSTRMIAQTCGITQPALYHHFTNKQSLYIAVLQHTLKQTENRLQSILNQYTSFHDRFYHMAMYMMLRFEVDMAQMFHDINHELSLEDQTKIGQWWKKGFLMPVVQVLEDGIANNEIKDPSILGTNSTELAFLVLNIIKSVLQAPNFSKLPEAEQRKTAERQAKLIVEIFINGMKDKSILK